MQSQKFTVAAKVWLYPGMAGWHFVTIPKKESKQVRNMFSGMARGFGSLPVVVTVGKTTWNTSIFFDSKSGTYLLALKADVRKKEQIQEGDTISLSFHVRGL